MADSLKFGTSGLRGLASDLVGAPSGRYAAAFLAHLAASGAIAAGDAVLVGQDLRDSSPAIAAAVLAAIGGSGFVAVDCGRLPTPALALAAQQARCAAVMVTGSHIPADRNGLKFYRREGEISKADEAGILKALESLAAPGESGAQARQWAGAREDYFRRYREAFAGAALAGLRIGVFQHSSVARDDLVTLLGWLGAEAVPLGRSDRFMPIDTEALDPETAARAAAWVAAERLDALVSTDGDADRPLVADETGAFIRGDLLGLLTARFLAADAVVTPVTSNSAIESTGAFERVVRTRVGSPYVIEGMATARRAGARVVVGFEANGGVLLGSDVLLGGRRLTALPTRDAVLPMLSGLAAARVAGTTLSRLVGALPARIARSDRLPDVPAERSAALLARLADPGFAAGYFAEVGRLDGLSRLDGLRFMFESGDVVHYRASGNAPELRCYVEAATEARAEALLAFGLGAAAREVQKG